MATKADTWMPFYVADYLKDTMALSRDEHGAYLLLIMAAWSAGGRLPNRPKALAAIAKSTLSEWEEIAPSILPYFTVEGDSLVHGRVVTEREKAQRLSDSRRATGSKGGRPKKQTVTVEKPIGLANENLEGLQTQTPSPSPISELSSSSISDANASSVGRPADEIRTAFDEWNSLAERAHLPKARKLDPARRKAIRTRLADGGLEAWREALAAVARSPLCLGENDRNWRADLDFVCQPKSWRRLLEGAYGGNVGAPSEDVWDDNRWRAALRINVEDGRWGDRLGPPPGQPGCRAPPPILAEFGFQINLEAVA